jgi:hypothetical protein
MKCRKKEIPDIQLQLAVAVPACRWVMHWLAQQPRFQRSQFVSVTTNLMSFGTSGLEGAMQGSKQVRSRGAQGCGPRC